MPFLVRASLTASDVLVPDERKPCLPFAGALRASGWVALAVTRQGSHGPGRACINASGSSADRLAAPEAIRARSVDRLRSLDVLHLFPAPGSAGRRFASLHRALRGEFPCFAGTIKALRLPAARPAALRCLRLAVPPASTRSVRSPADECAAEAWSWSPGSSGRDVAEGLSRNSPWRPLAISQCLLATVLVCRRTARGISAEGGPPVSLPCLRPLGFAAAGGMVACPGPGLTGHGDGLRGSGRGRLLLDHLQTQLTCPPLDPLDLLLAHLRFVLLLALPDVGQPVL
jgi:hypothetical protein